MAKNKRVKPKHDVLLTIPDVAHADISIKRVGDLMVKIQTAEGAAKEKIDRIKSELQDKVDKINDDIDLHVKSLEAFADANIELFGKARSKKLAFGVIGWRSSTSISTQKTTLQKIKELLSPAQRKMCINTKETVSKDGLAKLKDEDLASVGARRKRQEAFFVEPDLVTAADYNRQG